MRRSQIAPVIEAVVLRLRASTTVTALATVWNNVPTGTAFPYVEVSSPTDRRVDTCGRFGADTLVDVHAFSQYHGDQEAADIISACQGALHFQTPTTTGHTALGVAYETGERFRETINGIITRHHVASFRVWTEQSTT